MRQADDVSMSAADAAQEAAVVELVRSVLDGDLIGVQRYGSAVHDGLRRFSDLDLLVVTRRTIGPARRRALVEGLLGISGPEPGARPRPVELTVVVAGEVRPWRYPPRVDLQYGEWLRPELSTGAEPPSGPDPDLAVLLTSVRERGLALAGPRATELLDPVPHEDLVRAVLDGLPGLLAELHTDTRNVVLTLARMLVTVRTGRIVPKPEAAELVLPRLSDNDGNVLAHARAVHAGEQEALPAELPGLDDFAARMAAAIRQAAIRADAG
ncbi:streptomycin 3'-adenylyltransferase [Actinopolyspora lacussalsi]|nr:streptomycin 3'-adenylyltransferase [Actinopolyspora lacussalsi]